MVVTLPLYSSSFIPNPVALSGQPQCTITTQVTTSNWYVVLWFYVCCRNNLRATSKIPLKVKALFSINGCSGHLSPILSPLTGCVSFLCQLNTESVVKFCKDIFTKQRQELNNVMRRQRTCFLYVITDINYERVQTEEWRLDIFFNPVMHNAFHQVDGMHYSMIGTVDALCDNARALWS